MIIRDLPHSVLRPLILIFGSLCYQIIHENLDFFVVSFRYEYNVTDLVDILYIAQLFELGQICEKNHFFKK